VFSDLPLLHHLQRGTKDSSSQVRLLVSEATFEAVGPAAEPGSHWDQLSLVLFVGDNLSDLGLNILRFDGLTSESGESRAGSFDVSSLDKVSRRIWQEHKTTTQDKGPSKLNANRDSVGACIGSVFGSVHNARSEKDTDGDAELVTCNQGTSDLSWALVCS